MNKFEKAIQSITVPKTFKILLLQNEISNLTADPQWC